MSTTSAYNRHHPHYQEDASLTTTSATIHEESPLFLRHMSMGSSFSDNDAANHSKSLSWKDDKDRFRQSLFRASLCVILMLLLGAFWMIYYSHRFVPIERAQEHFVEVDPDIFLWYRTWGNREGIPVLFVHGGPGNAIADYYNGNKRFFAPDVYFVIEVDQRGTGQSRPSVRDHAHNFHYYSHISIDQIAADYEVVRQALGLEKWLVFGGSFGSTISINYGTRYPERCLALIVRAIYLDTAVEVASVYSRRMHLNNSKRLAEFDILYEYAVQKSARDFLPASPDDAEGLMRAYYELIMSGDEKAMWHWFVFENNLMEWEPENLYDPYEIDMHHIREARSVSFFETRLWLTGTYEQPSNLLSRVDQLTTMPIWICQGRRDEVCPPKYARLLADALDDEGAYYSVRFMDSGHEQSDPVMARCLEDSLHDFRHELEATADR